MFLLTHAKQLQISPASLRHCTHQASVPKSAENPQHQWIVWQVPQGWLDVGEHTCGGIVSPLLLLPLSSQRRISSGSTLMHPWSPLYFYTTKCATKAHQSQHLWKTEYPACLIFPRSQHRSSVEEAVSKDLQSLRVQETESGDTTEQNPEKENNKHDREHMQHYERHQREKSWRKNASSFQQLDEQNRRNHQELFVSCCNVNDDTDTCLHDIWSCFIKISHMRWGFAKSGKKSCSVWPPAANQLCRVKTTGLHCP